MKNFFIALTFICLVGMANSAQAQNYKSSLGLRLGATNGITYKTFVTNKAAVEVIGTFRYQGIGLTGLYEVHGQAFNSRDFNWFIGGGGHLYSFGNNRPAFIDNNKSIILGVDGILGLEAKVRTIPLAISLDWKPALNIVNYGGFWADEVALSFRYTFR
jgi:hypothetical protein